MSAGADGAALVGLLQQLGGGQGALSPERLVVLLAETARPLEGADDQRDGCQLRLGVADLVLVQREGLRGRRGGSGRHLATPPHKAPGHAPTCDMNS